MFSKNYPLYTRCFIVCRGCRVFFYSFFSKMLVVRFCGKTVYRFPSSSFQIPSGRLTSFDKFTGVLIWLRETAPDRKYLPPDSVFERSHLLRSRLCKLWQQQKIASTLSISLIVQSNCILSNLKHHPNIVLISASFDISKLRRSKFLKL